MGKINIKQLVKRFGKATVIKGTDLDINDGEFVVFVGPSGCGKSTILRMIAGLEEITSGTIEIDGVVVNNLPPVQRGISMVFQTYALYPHLTVYENIAFPLRVAKLSQDKVEERVQYAAKALQLEERLNHKPGELSGGQRQRVAIGRAIVREPKVFLFDEPLSNLDAALRADMRIELSELHDKLGNTMIYVTHDQIEAMTMADKIVVLRAGNIEQIGSPLELYHHPSNRFVASFIGSPNMNFFKATTLKSLDAGMSILLDGKDIVLPVTPRDVSIGHKVEVGIRPEDIHIGEGDISLDVTVDVIEKLGSSTLIYAHSPLSADRIRIVIPKTVDIKTGKNITIGFNKHDCHLFDTQEQAFQRQN